MNVRPLRAADIEWADLVMASAMLVQKDALQRVIARCKADGKRVVVGGPYVTTGADQVPEADHLFLGEAETTMPEFLSDLERGEARRIYQAAERPALSAAPIPEFGLADLKQYSAMSVQYSRGCPFQCEFCDITEIYGRVPRTKSNVQVLDELNELMRVGWRGTVFIVDDNFIGNKRDVKRLLPELAEWSDRNGHPFTFITEASVNLAEDEELLDGMRRAGFRRVFLGIETPVEASLKEARKTQNLRGDLLDAVRKIQSYGMEVMGGFIVGFDNDPEDIFERQIRFIRESAIPLAMVGLLNALPETQLWRRLQREGRLLTESTGNNTDCSLNFVPRMDPARLAEGYQTIMRTIYSPAEYYQRVLDSFQRMPHQSSRPVWRRLTRSSGPRGSAARPDGPLAELLTLARVVLALGVRDRGRGEFWRYMGRVYREHRDRLGQAVRLAATGYHCRKLTDQLG
jgi:radical SAM superfamily enzyme YgiQ (UPF0313 family)